MTFPNTTFVSQQTVITALWLQAVNDFCVAPNTLATDLANTSDPAKGDALLGVELVATGAAARTQHNKNAENVTSLDFAGVDPTGSLDSTAGLQAMLNAMVSGQTTRVVSGNYVTSSMLTMSAANACLLLDEGATITYSSQTCLKVTGTNSSVLGGHDGGFIGVPVSFNVTASISHSTLSVTAASGVIQIGMDVIVAGVPKGYVSAFGTGTGGTGNYTITWPVDPGIIGSQTMVMSTFNGTNAALSYATIWVTGNNCTVSTRLYNVARAGIWFKDVLDATAYNCVIEGNYPVSQWVNSVYTETGHMGISYDPALSSDPAGDFKAYGNTVKSCVQGIFVGNYGAGQYTQGFVATGNILNDCWNHGIYTNYSSGAVITGNNFNRCQCGIAASGPKNVIVGNTFYTNVLTVGLPQDVTGISMRDPDGCVVNSNTFSGVLDANNSVAINFQNFDGASSVKDNVCQGNVVNVTAGTGVLIRITSAATAIKNNNIQGNVIRGLGKQYEGIISIEGNAASASASTGNTISGNTITLLGESHGIYSTYLNSVLVQGNSVTYEYNAGAPVSVSSVIFYTCTGSTSSLNESICSSAFGTNVTVTGYNELTGCLGNHVMDTINSIDTTHATWSWGSVLANSKLDINDSSTGAPGFTANPGSLWRRTDGGAATTLYLKETAYTSTTWRAV